MAEACCFRLIDMRNFGDDNIQYTSGLVLTYNMSRPKANKLCARQEKDLHFDTKKKEKSKQNKSDFSRNFGSQITEESFTHLPVVVVSINLAK